MIVILTATRHELAPLIKRLSPERRASKIKVPSWRGMLSGREVLVMQTGLGREGVEKAAVGIPRPVDCLINAGFAGALREGLAAGDLLFDFSRSNPVFQKTAQTIAREKKWPFHMGALHTSDRVAASPSEKSDLARETGALAVDMESDHAAALAVSLGASYAGIRAIFDRSEESLEWMLEDGKPLSARDLARKALTTPGLWGPLFQAYRTSGKAAGRLSAFLSLFVSCL